MASIDVDDAQLRAALQLLQAKGDDLTPSMQVIADMLVAGVQDQFDSQGGGAWPGFADSTLRRRSGGVLLQDTGRFAGSIRAKYGADFAEATTDVSYAVHHVYGAPKANLPRRDPFDIDEDVFEDAADYILEQVSK